MRFPTQRVQDSGGFSRFLIFVLLCAALGFVLWRLHKPKDDPSQKADRAIPVRTGQARLENVPYYLSGLGTVLSPNQVTIRAQVDGELTALHFTEGATVSKGDLLAEIDRRPFNAALNQAKAQKANVLAQLNLAQVNLARNEKLLRGDAVSQAEVDQTRAQVEELKASAQSADADIASAQVKLGYTTILSPISGRVGLRRVDAGNIISASDANGLVTITQVDPISVLFTLPQSALAQIGGATRESGLPVIALDKEGGRAIASGVLETIDNQVDSSNGTIRLKASFDNSGGALWPGQHVTARLQRAVQENAIVVPVQAVQIGRDNNFVYRVKPDNTVEAAPVDIAFQDDTIAVISKGLNAGDTVVTDGQMRLTTGAKITTGDKKEEAKDEAAPDAKTRKKQDKEAAKSGKAS